MKNKEGNLNTYVCVLLLVLTYLADDQFSVD